MLSYTSGRLLVCGWNRVALIYPPKVGEIFMCEFPECFGAPEMVKTRPVVVVSPSLRGRPDLVAVVPISHSAPSPFCAHHCVIPHAALPSFMQKDETDRWAKCDMLYTFSTRRLSPIHLKRDRRTGRRGSEYRRVDLATLQTIRRAAAAGLGIDATLWPR